MPCPFSDLILIYCVLKFSKIDSDRWIVEDPLFLSDDCIFKSRWSMRYIQANKFHALAWAIIQRVSKWLIPVDFICFQSCNIPCFSVWLTTGNSTWFFSEFRLHWKIWRCLYYWWENSFMILRKHVDWWLCRLRKMRCQYVWTASGNLAMISITIK